MAQKTKTGIVSNKKPLDKPNRKAIAAEEQHEARKYSEPKLTREIHEAINSLRDIKDEKEELAKQTKKLNEQETYLEDLLISKLRAEGLDKVSTDKGTASIKHDVYPAVKDWDVFTAYMLSSKDFSLLTKNVRKDAWRERHESGEAVPGISAFEKDTLNFRRSK
jgi:hypothetical protein